MRKVLCVFGLAASLVLASPGSTRALQQSVEANRQEASQDSVPGSRKQLALGVVASAAQAATQAEPESRGLLLVLAGDAVFVADPELAKNYYASAFEATEEMVLLARFNIRVGLQESIVARFVSLDPDKALELLQRVDKPQWTGYPGEDIRSRSASLLASTFLRGNSPDDVEKTIALLEYLGNTGQYPYRAAAELIKFFHHRGEDWRGAG